MTTVRKHKKQPITVGILTVPNEPTPVIPWLGPHIIIPYDTPTPELYYSRVKGLIIPGGDTPRGKKHHAFLRTIIWFLERSLQPGEYFPILGICLGMEYLLYAIGGFSTLPRYEQHDPVPIQIRLKSRMFNQFPLEYRAAIQAQGIIPQDHLYGISPAEFLANRHLALFFRITSTAKDKDDREFVNTMEARGLPVYGIQSHPDRQAVDPGFLPFFMSELRK